MRHFPHVFLLAIASFLGAHSSALEPPTSVATLQADSAFSGFQPPAPNELKKFSHKQAPRSR
jgi:hypothetical protein